MLPVLKFTLCRHEIPALEIGRRRVELDGYTGASLHSERERPNIENRGLEWPIWPPIGMTKSLPAWRVLPAMFRVLLAQLVPILPVP